MMKISGLLLSAAILAVAALFTTGCTEQNNPDNHSGAVKKITDCAGREVTVPVKVTRVVDLALLDGTRTLVELNAESLLVGINDTVKNFMFGKEGQNFSCWFAAPKKAPQIQSLPSVGSCREPGVEFIASLKPDIILASASYGDQADAIEKQTGIPVVCIRAFGCLDFKMLQLVADLVGKQERARFLISYAEETIRGMAQRTAAIPKDQRVKVFFWGWPVSGAPRTIAPYDPIDLAGGFNVAMQAAVRPYESYNTTKEQLAVWNPDVIMLQWWTKKDIGVRITTILSDPCFQTVSAVKNRQVFYWRTFMKGWDPAMGLCEIFYLAKLFYPEANKEMDVEARCNEIMATFYEVEGLYTDLLANSEIHSWKQKEKP